MLRPLRLPELIQPPHGWREIAWEIFIVTVGVFIALATQEWADNRSWASKAAKAKSDIADEVSDHYAWSVEWRMVEPCILRQIDDLQQRVLKSGSTLDPAAIHSEENVPSYILREPIKEYHDDVWQAVISDGVSAHLEPSLRRELESHYTQAHQLAGLSGRNQADQDRLRMLGLRLTLDPSTRFQLLQILAELRGRTEFMSLLSGQLIDHVAKEEMTPRTAATREKVLKYGTYKFCTAQHLPTRSFSEAASPVAN